MSQHPLQDVSSTAVALAPIYWTHSLRQEGKESEAQRVCQLPSPGSGG